MFEQHPVPQQISSYQFRLVGDMTIKQFFQLAGGGLISLLFYASPFPGLIKWPLVIFFAIGGAALAFLPFEERPLDQWVLAFFRSVYSTTLYTWKKPQAKYVFFTDDASTLPQTQQEEAAASATQAMASKSPFLEQLEETEKNLLSSVTNLFSMGSKAPAPPPMPQQASPAQTQQVITPPAAAPVVQHQTQTVLPSSPQKDINMSSVQETLSPTQQQTIALAQFSPDAAPPTPPSQPNVIVGQVMDSNGKIAEGAIIEIKDSMGRPVRALRTNKAGHFLIVTPLTNGKYTLVAEKEGLTIDPVEIEMVGTVVQPIAIKAKANSI